MIIVLTGGIGSGKSEVCSILAENYGFHVYEADSKVKELYISHPSLLSDIETALGANCRTENGVFQPALLAELIFRDKDSLQKVESLVFPALSEDFDKWMADQNDGLPVVFESATVLEKTYFDGFGDMNVLVNAPFDLRLSRAVERDGDRNRVKSRMTLQNLMNRLSEGFVDERIDFVIDNSGTLDDLKSRIHDFVSYIDCNKNVISAQQRC